MIARTGPWGLTNREHEVIRAVLSTGSVKGASREIGVCEKTIEGHMKNIRERIGKKGRLLCLLAFFEWDLRQRIATESAAEAAKSKKG